MDFTSILVHRHQAVPDTLQRIRHSGNHYYFSPLLGKSRKHNTEFPLSYSEPVQFTRNSHTAEKPTHGRHPVHSPLCHPPYLTIIMCVCERVREHVWVSVGVREQTCACV